MNPKNKTSQAVRTMIIEFSKTMTYDQICETLNVGKSIVYRVLRSHGLSTPLLFTRTKLQKRMASIKQDIKNGLNRKQIAHKYGVSITAINNFARARGIKLPDTRKTNASQMRDLEADIPLIYQISPEFTPKQLADKWDVPVSVMQMFLKKHNFETKRSLQ